MPGPETTLPKSASATRFNWPRGLFRLWIVSSVVWIGVNVVPSVSRYIDVTSTLESTESTGNWKARAKRIVTYNGVEYKVPSNATDIEIAKLISTTSAEPRDLLAVANDVLAGLHKADADQRIAARRDLFSSVLSALAGPLAVLLAGLASAWVILGFRGNGKPAPTELPNPTDSSPS